jgi:transcriptional regulator with XRE-family HTH domain
MPKFKSELLEKQVPEIRKMLEQDAAWVTGRGYNARWKPFSRKQIEAIFSGLNPTILVLEKLAHKLGISLGELLGLGRWNYDDAGISRRVKKFRCAKNLSARALSENLGGCKEYITQLEQGEHKGGFRICSMEKLAKALDITLEQLLSPEKN